MPVGRDLAQGIRVHRARSRRKHGQVQLSCSGWLGGEGGHVTRVAKYGVLPSAEYDHVQSMAIGMEHAV